MNFIKLIWKYIKIFKSLVKFLVSRRIVCTEEESAEAYLRQIAPPPESTPCTENNIGDAETDLMIIVPAYNSELWIEECILSILSQKTEYSFKAVFVDDGSTDSTGEILDRFTTDSKVTIIHQDNRGYSGARNVALKNICSKYIMFVDSDDYLLPNAIQCLMDTAQKEDADIVEGNGYTFNEKCRINRVKQDTSSNVEDSYWGGPCLKIMKASLWKNFEFPEGYLYEDTIIGSLIFPSASKICFVDDEIYAYRIHNNSITQKHDTNLRRVDSFWIMLLMASIQDKCGIARDYNSYRKAMKHIVFTYRRTILLPERVKEAIFICTKAFLEKYYNEYVNKKDKYYLLAYAIMKKNYAKYAVY